MILHPTPKRLTEDSPDYQRLHLELRQRVDGLLARYSIPLKSALTWLSDEYQVTVRANMKELTAGQLARVLKQVQAGELDHLRRKQGGSASVTPEAPQAPHTPARPKLQPWITGNWPQG